MREIRWIKYSFRSKRRDPCIWTKRCKYSLYFLQNRIGSNGGCCLTHVNMRCLGDFAEMSWLWVGFEQMWVVEKANWNWRLIWQLGSVLTSRPQYECGKLSAAQYGNKMRGFVYLFLFFFFHSFLARLQVCRCQQILKILLPLELKKFIFDN